MKIRIKIDDLLMMQQTECLKIGSNRYEIDAEICEFDMARKTGIHRIMNAKIKIDAQNIKNAALNFNKNRNKNRKIKTAQTQCLSRFSVAGVQGLEPWAHGFGDHCSTN